MLRWIGIIAYVIMSALVLLVVEGPQVQGVNGIQRSEYAREHIINKLDDENYTTQEGLNRLNAAWNYYVSDETIKTKDGQASYDTTNQTTNDLAKVKFSIYPYASILKDPTRNIWYDGFYIVLEEYNSEVVLYSINLLAYNINDESKTPISVSGEKALLIYTDRTKISQAIVPHVTYTNNGLIAQNVTTETHPEGIMEYDIYGIEIYAYTSLEQDVEPQFIARFTDGEQNLATGNPIVTSTNLNLTANTFNISKNLSGSTPTAAEAEQFNLVTLYHPADFSPYNHIYFIVYGLYAIFFAVLPYFLFIHKPLRKALKKRKLKKLGLSEEEKSDAPVAEQIFSDVEPKSDKK